MQLLLMRGHGRAETQGNGVLHHRQIGGRGVELTSLVGANQSGVIHSGIL